MTVNESNWLDSKIIECAHCGQRLYWLWHSPMYDDTFFYCTQCPKRVEVSHYDEHVAQLRKLATQETKLFALIEENLADCECGGHFEYGASRRCLRCFSVLAHSEPGRDVWPPEADDENADSQSLSFPIESLVKTKNIWRR
jgi:hypothetical protein